MSIEKINRAMQMTRLHLFSLLDTGPVNMSHIVDIVDFVWFESSVMRDAFLLCSCFPAFMFSGS